MTYPPTILFIGGGSGGHIYPNLALAEPLQAEKKITPHFIISRRNIDKETLGEHAANATAIDAQPLTGHPAKLLCLATNSLKAIRQTRDIIRQHQPVAAVATGGFVSAPAALACQQLKLPLALVNLDAVPGKANRFCAKFTDPQNIFSCFDSPLLPSATRIQMPLRQSVKLPDDITPETAREKLGLDPNRKTLLVFGGSQGGETINQLVRHLAKQLPLSHPNIQADWQILHITGPQPSETIKAITSAYQTDGWTTSQVLPFCHNMGNAYRAADLAICRAGASTVFELWTNHVPAIFLPYPYHKDQHQRLNAAPMVETKGAYIVNDQIDPEQNWADVKPLLLDRMLNAKQLEATKQHLLESASDSTDLLTVWLNQRIPN